MDANTVSPTKSQEWLIITPVPRWAFVPILLFASPLFFGLFGVYGFIALFSPNDPMLLEPFPWGIAILCSILGLLLLICLLRQFYIMSGFGTWRLDEERIVFQHHWKRQPQIIRWRDVERLQWYKHAVHFEGNQTSFTFYWQGMPVAQRERVKDQVRNALPPISTSPICRFADSLLSRTFARSSFGRSNLWVLLLCWCFSA